MILFDAQNYGKYQNRGIFENIIIFENIRKNLK